MKTCAVLYLERWSNKHYFTNAFLDSMRRFDAGAAFDYIHIQKGFESPAPSAPVQRYMDAGHKAEVFNVPDDRPALSVMADVARQLPHEKVILFMSWSRIQAVHWLRHYLAAFDNVPNCGIVGATSGYERRDLKDPNEPFPNVGIRSTAFMTERKAFVEAAGDWIRSRKDENDFEAGSNGLTKQIMRKGKIPVVVDKWGKAWHVDQWPQSKTFRSGFQEGLLISDNRTYQYDVLPNKKRKWLAEINWGTSEHVSWASPVRRLNAYLDWHYRGR